MKTLRSYYKDNRFFAGFLAGALLEAAYLGHWKGALIAAGILAAGLLAGRVVAWFLLERKVNK